MENLEYNFNCGNDTLISCHGKHKVTIYDVLSSVFTILVNTNKKCTILK